LDWAGEADCWARAEDLNLIQHSQAQSAIHLQRRNERFLRDVDLAEPPHLLAFLLFLQKLPLAREAG
jgi:hypothetical protein